MELTITLTPLADHDEIAQKIISLGKTCDVAIAFDPWYDMALAQCLLKRGFPATKLVERKEKKQFPHTLLTSRVSLRVAQSRPKA